MAAIFVVLDRVRKSVGKKARIWRLHWQTLLSKPSWVWINLCLSLSRCCSFFLLILSFPVLCPVGPKAPTSSVNSLTKADKSDFYQYWSQQKSVPFFLIIVLFPLCSIKSPTFFTKFNSLGRCRDFYQISKIISLAYVSVLFCVRLCA